MIPDYTLVCGVDARHLEQLSWTWPTWIRHKPSLLKHPMIVFYDWREVTFIQVQTVLKEHPNLEVIAWPPEGIVHDGDNTNKWDNPRRHRMLSGFVYVPAACVQTPYWLKIDTDAIATRLDDWIDPEWFKGDPAIIAHRWTYTKPADQMLQMDQWIEDHPVELSYWAEKPPLNLVPLPGWSRLKHQRVASWCAFFHTEFTQNCAKAAEVAYKPFQLPVPSQDGFLWYMATRGQIPIRRVSIKRRGWVIRATRKGILQLVEESMNREVE